MLQIQPEKDIVIEFIKQDEFKYVRCLGMDFSKLAIFITKIFFWLGQKSKIPSKRCPILTINRKFAGVLRVPRAFTL